MVLNMIYILEGQADKSRVKQQVSLLLLILISKLCEQLIQFIRCYVATWILKLVHKECDISPHFRTGRSPPRRRKGLEDLASFL